MSQTLGSVGVGMMAKTSDTSVLKTHKIDKNIEENTAVKKTLHGTDFSILFFAFHLLDFLVECKML